MAVSVVLSGYLAGSAFGQGVDPIGQSVKLREVVVIDALTPLQSDIMLAFPVGAPEPAQTVSYPWGIVGILSFSPKDNRTRICINDSTTGTTIGVRMGKWEWRLSHRVDVAHVCVSHERSASIVFFHENLTADRASTYVDVRTYHNQVLQREWPLLTVAKVPQDKGAARNCTVAQLMRAKELLNINCRRMSGSSGEKEPGWLVTLPSPSWKVRPIDSATDNAVMIVRLDDATLFFAPPVPIHATGRPAAMIVENGKISIPFPRHNENVVVPTVILELKGDLYLKFLDNYQFLSRQGL